MSRKEINFYKISNYNHIGFTIGGARVLNWNWDANELWLETDRPNISLELSLHQKCNIKMVLNVNEPEKVEVKITDKNIISQVAYYKPWLVKYD